MPPPVSSPTSHICRPCLRLLTSNPSFSSSSPSPPIRAFTTTTPRRIHGAVPTFTPTTSPELDTLLSSLRTRIFLPSHLMHTQRLLIYRQKHHDLLSNADEPATAKLGSEIHVLHPLRHKDEPGVQRSLDQALNMMREVGEWANLAPMLQGLREAGRQVRGRWLERGVRCALAAGGAGRVMEGLRQVGETGMSVWVCEEQGVAREVLWGAVVKHLVEGERREARKWAEALWEMCWVEMHALEQGKGGQDPRRMPDFVAGLMLVHALDGADVGKVERFAREVVRGWDNKECVVPRVDEVKKSKKVVGEANKMLMMWCPALAGMRVGGKFLGVKSEAGKAFEKMMKEVEPVVEECLAIVKGEQGEVGKVRRGAVIYEEMAKIE